MLGPQEHLFKPNRFVTAVMTPRGLRLYGRTAKSRWSRQFVFVPITIGSLVEAWENTEDKELRKKVAQTICERVTEDDILYVLRCYDCASASGTGLNIALRKRLNELLKKTT